MIRNVIFDLGNVLVPLDLGRGLARLRPHLPTERARLLDEDEEGFFALFRNAARELETGRIGFDRFSVRMQEILGTGLEEEEFRIIWCDIFSMDNRMVALGERLSKRYDTFLASNTSRVHYEWILDRFPRVAFYRDAALSYELGVMKPEVRFFEKALDRFAADASESLFIDDLPENVAGAREAGMTAILFKGHDRLLHDLVRAGVDPQMNVRDDN